MFQEEQTVDNFNQTLARIEAAILSKQGKSKNSQFPSQIRNKNLKVAFARIEPSSKDKLERFLFKHKLEYRDWLMATIDRNCHI
jgi:hypothetical protein